MILDVVDRPGDPFVAMRRLLTDNHEPRKRQLQHIREAVGIARSLLQAGVLERLDEPDADGRRYRLTVDLPPDFALNQPLSTFALAAVERARPGVGDLCAGRRLGHRGDPRGPTPDPGGAAEQGQGRGRGRDEGRRHRVRRANRAAGRGHLSQAARRAARTHLRGVPAEQPVGRRRAAVAEVRRARDVGAGLHVPGVRQRLRADPLRGRGAALPLRRVQGAAVRGARRRADRGGHRHRRVARRACPPS